VLLKNVTLPTDENVVLIDLFIPLERRRNGAAVAPSEASAYLSPEQRAGRDVTAAGHVYSLGAILFRLLGGRLPTGPVTIGEMALGRVFGRATGLERERPELTTATHYLVNRSLRQDARGRFADIESFQTALDAALAAEEIRLSAATGRALAAERRPLAWLLPLAILALLLAVGAVAARGLLVRGDAPTLTPTTVVVVATEGAETPTEAPAPTDAPVTAAPLVAATAPATPAPTAEDSQALSTPTPTVTATTEPSATLTVAPTTPPIVRVVFNLANLRRGPGVVYPLQGSVAAGEALAVLAWNNDEENVWYLVVTEDQRIGWIAASVVQPDEAAALAGVPPAATLPPTPFPTVTLTATPSPTMAVVIAPTEESGDLGGNGNGGGTRPPEPPTAMPTAGPTAMPTDPPEPPTATPKPFETQEP